MNRRRLLQGISLGVLSAKLTSSLPLYGSSMEAEATEPAKEIAANDRVNVGVIGPGSRGKELIRQLLRTPGVEIAAVCDVYEPRFTQVNELVGKKVPACKDYRELLERKDLDAIFVATPPIFHARHAMAAMRSGRPVYCEKIIGFTPEDCADVTRAVAATGQIFQVGHQMRYGSWIREAVERVHKGEIGEPTQVYAYWHRRNNWRREVPTPDMEHLINWRLYKETSGGLFEELGSHHIDIANWVFGEQPQDVMGASSIAAYHDGRTVGDNVQAVLGYSKGRRMLFSSVTDNGLMGDQLWIYGSEGSVQITLEDATFYGAERKSVESPSPADVVQRGLKTGASYQSRNEMPYRGPGDRLHLKKDEDPTLSACKSFIECVRTKQRPFADVVVGYGSGIACSVGKHSFEEGRVLKIPQLNAMRGSMLRKDK